MLCTCKKQMFILAGLASGAGLWYCSETFRSRTRQAGLALAWYGMRVYVQVEMYTDDIVQSACAWAGWTESPNESQVELVSRPGEDAQYFIRRGTDAAGNHLAVVGKTAEDVENRREPCTFDLFAPVVRVRQQGGKILSYPIEFDGEQYCIVGNVLFDHAFVEYWLRTRFQYELGSEDTWETSFLGPNMTTQKVTHLQRAICEKGELRIESYEEPPLHAGDSSPSREPWILDLNGRHNAAQAE